MEANPPFLPPSEPSDNPAVSPQQKKSKAKKTIALWVLLIVMFISIYQLFSGPTQGHGRAAPRCPEPSFWSGDYVLFGLPILVTVALFLLMRRAVRGNTLYSVRCE